MWELSISVFGCSRFTYGELASQAREPNVALVRRATRRLAIVERCEQYHRPNSTKSADEPSTAPTKPATAKLQVSETDALWAGDTEWRWIIRDGIPSRCHHCNLAPGCWRKKIREGCLASPQPGLDYLQKLISYLQSPLS
jgi:hypothetical protein